MTQPLVVKLLEELFDCSPASRCLPSVHTASARDDFLRFSQRLLQSKEVAFSDTLQRARTPQLQQTLIAQGKAAEATRLALVSLKLSSAGLSQEAYIALLTPLAGSGPREKESLAALSKYQALRPTALQTTARANRAADQLPGESNGSISPKPTTTNSLQMGQKPWEGEMHMLVREVLCASQDISGDILDLKPNDDAIRLDAASGVSVPERQLMLRLAELGWLFRKLRDQASRKGELEGSVRQAFRGGLHQEIADFYRLLATLEAQASQPLPTNSNAPGNSAAYLTLRRLLVWLGDPLVRLRWLAAVSESVADLSGGRLLAALEAATAHGQPLVRDALRRCLKLAAAPMLSQICLWVFQGRLQQSPGASPEFFVVSNKDPGSGRLWREGYRLEESMKPSFISEQLANRILRAGKSLNFLRENCGDSEWTQQAARTSLASSASSLQYGQTEALERIVTQAGAEIDRHVVETLHAKYGLTAHFDALKRYVLLGQGDFIQALMDSVGAELEKPAGKISTFVIESNLDVALRASSAQYDAPEQINRVRTKIETAQANDQGWDVFALTYTVDEPIATVLDGDAMQAYQRVAKLLWLLKRAEHSLNEAWVELNGLQRQLSAFPILLRRTGLRAYSMEDVWVCLRHFHGLRNEMAHLVTSLQSYIMFEVLEAAWEAFQARLASIRDMDSLIQAHEEYLATLERKTLLTEDKAAAALPTGKKQSVQDALRALLAKTLELRPATQKLTDLVSGAVSAARRETHKTDASARTGTWASQGGSQPVLGVRPDELVAVQRRLDDLSDKYSDKLGKFEQLLPQAANVDLRFLTFRLESGGRRNTDDGSSSRSSQP